MVKRDMGVLYCSGFFCCILYMFFLRDCVQSVLDFYLWIVPGVCMMFVPLLLVRVKELVDNG